MSAESHQYDQSHTVLEIPEFLVFPLGPSLTKRTGSEEPTWSVPIEQLTEVLEEAWNSLDPEGKDIASNMMDLPELSNNKSIPYRNALGEKFYFFLIIISIFSKMRQQ